MNQSSITYPRPTGRAASGVNLTQISHAPAAPLPDTLDTEEATDLQVGLCPYYIRDRGKGRVYCECCRFSFPDKGARREIIYRYCAHPTGYKSCMIKQCMDNFYERKYSEHGIETF